jgi:AraC-like DNA-binding protein
VDLRFQATEPLRKVFRSSRFSGLQPVLCDRHFGARLDHRRALPVGGGALPFFGVPANELADRHVDLETLWGPPAVELRERLCAAVDSAERFSLLEKALAARWFGPREHGAVRIALQTFKKAGPYLRVRDVARQVGLSQRRFIQVFAHQVGMRPKLFCRVQRFQRAIELARQMAAPNWALLAVECGYFDQAHLIHDFQAFSGLSPTEYARRRSERVMLDHIPLVG